MTNNGKPGGVLKGKTHEEGGMPAVITNDGNRPVELETEEVIITAPAMKSEDHVVCEGTPKGVASAINNEYGGVKFSDKGNCKVVKKKRGGTAGAEDGGRETGVTAKPCGCSHIFKKGGELTTVNYKNQHEMNRAIESLIDSKGESREYTDEEKLFLNRYTGAGGLAKKGASGKGLLYEYYTPDLIIQKMWALVQKYGYSTGPILEPSVGIGRFFKYAPKGESITGFEINPYSAKICSILYPEAIIQNAAFETMFFRGNMQKKPNEIPQNYALVIGNPPYGDFGGKYAGMGEQKTTKAKEYDQYFLTRGLDMLISGGLLCFIIPSSFLQNGNLHNKFKETIAAKAELVDAYRLPRDVFETTEIGTDIVVFKKL